MTLFRLDAEPFPTDQVGKKLEEQHILTNRYAGLYFSHPAFSTETASEITIAIMQLKQIGLVSGATLSEIFQRVSEVGYKPCPASTGVFLRLQWKDQPKSGNAVLSGTHRSPDGAVVVLSDLLEQDDAFPKGLYLRNVEDRLWLRGYVCDSAYRFSGEDLFAFEAGSVSPAGWDEGRSLTPEIER
ncbi:MAG: hypothetical protein IKH34_02840 [Oscillospiraceae bacterium]|nr:hypothetical protein [Oscillospiraceae bacterium]